MPARAPEPLLGAGSRWSAWIACGPAGAPGTGIQNRQPPRRRWHVAPGSPVPGSPAHSRDSQFARQRGTHTRLSLQLPGWIWKVRAASGRLHHGGAWALRANAPHPSNGELVQRRGVIRAEAAGGARQRRGLPCDGRRGATRGPQPSPMRSRFLGIGSVLSGPVRRVPGRPWACALFCSKEGGWREDARRRRNAPCRCRITKAYQGRRRLADDGEVPWPTLLDDSVCTASLLGRKGEAASTVEGPWWLRVRSEWRARRASAQADGWRSPERRRVGRVAASVHESEVSPRISKRRRRRLRRLSTLTMSSASKPSPPMTVWLAVRPSQFRNSHRVA